MPTVVNCSQCRDWERRLRCLGRDTKASWSLVSRLGLETHQVFSQVMRDLSVYRTRALQTVVALPSDLAGCPRRGLIEPTRYWIPQVDED